MKYDKSQAKELILRQWRALPDGERSEARAAAFALQAAKDYPFDSASACAVIRLWLTQDLG
jgi:hypothetical protein